MNLNNTIRNNESESLVGIPENIATLNPSYHFLSKATIYFYLVISLIMQLR